MINVERVIALLAEANPIPDVDSLDLVEIGAASYLTALNQRSREVT